MTTATPQGRNIAHFLDERAPVATSTHLELITDSDAVQKELEFFIHQENVEIIDSLPVHDGGYDDDDFFFDDEKPDGSGEIERININDLPQTPLKGKDASLVKALLDSSNNVSNVNFQKTKQSKYVNTMGNVNLEGYLVKSSISQILTADRESKSIFYTISIAPNNRQIWENEEDGYQHGSTKYEFNKNAARDGSTLFTGPYPTYQDAVGYISEIEDIMTIILQKIGAEGKQLDTSAKSPSGAPFSLFNEDDASTQSYTDVLRHAKGLLHLRTQLRENTFDSANIAKHIVPALASNLGFSFKRIDVDHGTHVVMNNDIGEVYVDHDGDEMVLWNYPSNASMPSNVKYEGAVDVETFKHVIVTRMLDCALEHGKIDKTMHDLYTQFMDDAFEYTFTLPEPCITKPFHKKSKLFTALELLDKYSTEGKWPLEFPQRDYEPS